MTRPTSGKSRSPRGETFLYTGMGWLLLADDLLERLESGRNLTRAALSGINGERVGPQLVISHEAPDDRPADRGIGDATRILDRTQQCAGTGTNLDIGFLTHRRAPHRHQQRQRQRLVP